jgi:hypothetical protein
MGGKWRHRGERKKLLKVCAQCGQEFEAEVHNARYCSQDCRDASMVYRRSAATIFERDSFTCAYCGRSSIEDSVKLAVDHIIPVVRGGTDRVENLLTACSECNGHKSAKLYAPDVILRLTAVARERNNAAGILPGTLIDLGADHRRKARKSWQIGPRADAPGEADGVREPEPDSCVICGKRIGVDVPKGRGFLRCAKCELRRESELVVRISVTEGGL